jgi:hypothetical protein
MNMHPRRLAIFLACSSVFAIVSAVPESSLWAVPRQPSSKPARTVWDGVYTTAQAARGRAQYEQTCATCHSSGEGPSLVGDSFLRRWFEDSLDVVFTKIRNTMPENAPGSLAESAYVDLLGFILEANGFPSGAEELTPNAEQLAGILIVGKEGPGGPVPNFSLVQVAGCLTQAADSSWVLTGGTEPVRARDPGESSPADLNTAGSKPPGTNVFRLMDLPRGREAFKGQRVQAKGLLMREPKETRLNVTSLQTFGQSCPPE